MKFPLKNFFVKVRDKTYQAGRYITETIEREIYYPFFLKELSELEFEIGAHSLPREDFPYMNTEQLVAMWRIQQIKKLLLFKRSAKKTPLDDDKKSRLEKIAKYFGLKNPNEED